MARQAFLRLAVLLSSFHIVSAIFNYSEAYEAKSIVDSLYERLQNNINVTEEHLGIVKKIQDLLGQLNNQQANSPEKLSLGKEKQPADSCKQIYDSKLSDEKEVSAKNGWYWIKTSQSGKEAIQTFCDIENGELTLVGKINGKVGNI